MSSSSGAGNAQDKLTEQLAAVARLNETLHVAALADDETLQLNASITGLGVGVLVAGGHAPVADPHDR
jgi:hypothetical protein